MEDQFIDGEILLRNLPILLIGIAIGILYGKERMRRKLFSREDTPTDESTDFMRNIEKVREESNWLEKIMMRLFLVAFIILVIIAFG